MLLLLLIVIIVVCCYCLLMLFVAVVLSLCKMLVRPDDIGLNITYLGVKGFEGCECQDDMIEG